MTSISGYTISNIIKGFVEKKFSPVDLINEYIAAYKKYNHIYKAWVNFDEEALLLKAKEASNKITSRKIVNSLEAIPIGVKDIINTQDFPTQMGSPIWKNFTPGNDARVLYYLKNAGAIVAGKTVTAEFAVHELNETINPHNDQLTPGTSSSGSAVAIALNTCPVTLGTQSAGSIIRPASFCGVYGFKPSFGLIPRTGVLKTTDSLDTMGFFVSKAEDLKTIFNITRVHGPNFPISNKILTNVNRQTKPVTRKWKVGICKTYTWENTPKYAKEAFLSFCKSLGGEVDIQVSECDLPISLNNSHEVHATIYNKSLAYYFRDEFKNSKLISPIMQNLIESGIKTSIEDYNFAVKTQNELINDLDSFLNGYDVIISLSTAGEAPKRSIKELDDPSLIWTLTHLPVIGIPKFISPNKNPYGIQIASRKYNDLLLLDFIDYLLSMEMIPFGSFPLLA